MSAPKARKIRVGDRFRWRRDGTLWRVKRVGDVSVQMVSLTDGIGMWVLYDWLQGEWVRPALRVRTRDLPEILRELHGVSGRSALGELCLFREGVTYEEAAREFLRIARKRARG